MDSEEVLYPSSLPMTQRLQRRPGLSGSGQAVCQPSPWQGASNFYQVRTGCSEHLSDREGIFPSLRPIHEAHTSQVQSISQERPWERGSMGAWERLHPSPHLGRLTRELTDWVARTIPPNFPEKTKHPGKY